MGVFHHQGTPKSWLSSFIIIFPTKVISFLSIPNFRIQPHHLMGVSLEWLNHLRITEMKRLQSGAETITGTMREILWRVGHFFLNVLLTFIAAFTQTMELMKSHVSDFTGYLVVFQQTAAQLDCVLWCFVSMSLDLWKTPTAEKARPWQHYRRQLWRWKIDHKSRYGKHSFGRLGWQKVYPSIMYHFNEWLGGFSVLYICLYKWKLQQSTLVYWDGGKSEVAIEIFSGQGPNILV